MIKANQVEIGSLTYKNMTNLGTMECSALPTNRSAVIHIVTRPILHNDNTLVVEWELVGKSSKMSFGVSSVSLKSLKKDNPKSKIQEAGKNGTNTTGNSVNVNASSGGAVNNPTVSVMP